MNREELDHLIRAAGAVAGADELIVFGSQAILATYDEGRLPDRCVVSMEADLSVPGSDTKAELIEGALGEGSQFHQTFGIYAEGTDDLSFLRLPDGWWHRTIRYRRPTTRGVTARCLEVHDLVVAKMLAFREKDLEFCAALVDAGLVDVPTLAERIEAVPGVEPFERERAVDFLRSRSPVGRRVGPEAPHPPDAREQDVEECGVWMPRAHARCTLPVGHAGHHRSSR